jgi:aryl-alcohol dehydrogenase-like predicted oxidoreductase
MDKVTPTNIVIGLAGFFNANYGLFRNGKALDKMSYLQQCLSMGFYQFDGAQLYGEFKGEFANIPDDGRMEIYTKIKGTPSSNAGKRTLIQSLVDSARTLPSRHYKGVYFHDTDHEYWKSDHAKEIATKIVAKGIGNVIGVSAYNDGDLAVAGKLSWCSLVQIPLNPLFIPDITLLPSNVDIVYRSIFLQGALIKPEFCSNHPQYKTLQAAVEALQELSTLFRITLAELMIRFALSFTNRPNTSVVVGARSTESLRGLARAIKGNGDLNNKIYNAVVQKIEQNRSGLIDPRTWDKARL